MQCCLGMAGPILHKTIVCAMLAHSPQTTLHRKIIFNVVWICLGQHCTRKLPVQYWTMVNRQRLWGKWPIQCCVDQAGTTLHKNIVYSILPKYVWDKIRKHKKITSAMMAQREQTSFCGKIAYSILHKKITSAMLADSTQTTLHKKITYNFVWIYLGQHCTKKLPAQLAHG